jgi:hypothetical protein
MRTSPGIASHKSLPCFSNKYELLSGLKKSTLNYCLMNQYKLIIIVDGGDPNYNHFIHSLYGTDAEIIYIDANSNAGSFHKQIGIALTKEFDFIEISEDDYIKFGKIDFNNLNKKYIYTAYNHPDNEKFIRRISSLISNGNTLSTTLSFIASREWLLKNYNIFYNFDIISDSEMWYSGSLNPPLRFCYKVKNLLIKNNVKLLNYVGDRIKIYLLRGVNWVHLANDSLPRAYKSIDKYKNLNDLADESCQIFKKIRNER